MSEKMHQLQHMEQSYQQLILQKQSIQSQILEMESAEEELKKTDTAYKIVGNIMVKSNPKELENEIKEGNETLSVRLKSIEKQEEDLKEKLKKLRQEMLEDIKKKHDSN